MKKVIYEDNNWTIEIVNDDENDPTIRVSLFKDCHFVDDLELNWK